ncbi:hypothetical protein G6F40_017458 [Rhizopus arrhizus]|nr:hypothetical protein G6F40_017458 [Rhizopus arrhizus]
MHLVSDGIDANTTGSFRALGRTHQVLVGANWSRQRTGQQSADLTANTPIDSIVPARNAIRLVRQCSPAIGRPAAPDPRRPPELAGVPGGRRHYRPEDRRLPAKARVHAVRGSGL